MQPSFRVIEETVYSATMNAAFVIANQRALAFAREHMSIPADDPIHQLADLFNTLAQRVAPGTVVAATRAGALPPVPTIPKPSTGTSAPPPPSAPVYPLSPDIPTSETGSDVDTFDEDAEED